MSGTISGSTNITATKATFTPGTTGVSTGLTVANGDLTAYRSGGTTGVVYLSSSGSQYVYWDGSAMQFGGTTTSISSSGVFSGQATTAKYADLAEKYRSDAAYEPGTVVEFGGAEEITISTQDSSRRIAGVVSTNPAHLMNSMLESEFTIDLALAGRVPVKVQGPIRKGDMLVSAGNGCARAEEDPKLGSVIGKALENFDGDEGTIEALILML